MNFDKTCIILGYLGDLLKMMLFFILPNSINSLSIGVANLIYLTILHSIILFIRICKYTIFLIEHSIIHFSFFKNLIFKFLIGHKPNKNR